MIQTTASAKPGFSRPRRPGLRAHRWRFPAGSIVQVGPHTFRWQRIEEDPFRPGGYRLLSGPLEVSDQIGYLDAADREIPVLRDPESGSLPLPVFPFCHVFYDTELAGRSAERFGPWFCLCGEWNHSQAAVRSRCLVHSSRFP